MTDDNMNREDQDLSNLGEGDTMTVPEATFTAPTVEDDDNGWGSDEALLPDGAGGPARDEWDTESAQEEIDLSELRVNMSSQEAEAESFPDLVPGKYRVAIFKVAVQRSKSDKNPGKPLYNVTYKVQDGQYKGAQIFGDYICLWEGALYSYSQLIKALGFPVSTGNNKVKTPAELIGKTLIVRLGMGKSNTSIDKITGETKTYDARMQVKGYFRDSQSSNVSAQVNELAP
jgi:hypothetical protein